LPALLQALLPVLSLLVTLLFAYLTRVAAERMKAGAAKDATLELVAAAEVVVRNVEQTVKPALIRAAADGKLSAEDFELLKGKALVDLKEHFSDQGQKVLAANGARIE